MTENMSIILTETFNARIVQIFYYLAIKNKHSF